MVGGGAWRFGTILIGAACVVAACSGRSERRPPAGSVAEADSGAPAATSVPPAEGGAGGVPVEQPEPEGGAAGAPVEPPSAGGAPTEPEPEPNPGSLLLPNTPPPNPPACLEPEPPMPSLPDAECAAGCRAIVAYPFDAVRGCTDTSAGERIACSCSTTNVSTNVSEVCLKSPGGQLWLAVRGQELGLYPENQQPVPPVSYDKARFGMCAEDEYYDTLQGAPSCDLVGCVGRHIDSHCGLPGTRAAVYQAECNPDLPWIFPAFDAQGCQKPECASDADCADSERCTNGVGWVPWCTYSSEGTCNCGSSWSYDYDPRVCVDTAVAGPRGAWRLFEEENLETGVFWRVTPNGNVVTNNGGVLHEAQLDPMNLQTVHTMVDSFYMRSGVATGFDCQTHSGIGGRIRLTVGEQSFYRDVSGCFYDLPLDWILEQL